MIAAPSWLGKPNGIRLLDLHRRGQLEAAADYGAGVRSALSPVDCRTHEERCAWHDGYTAKLNEIHDEVAAGLKAPVPLRPRPSEVRS